MILYHAISSYQLLHSIVHKEVFHRNEQCHIVLSSYIINKFPQFMQLKGAFFDEVFTFNNANNNKNLVKDDYISCANEIFNELFNEDKNIDNYSEIIVGCAHGFFGVYLISNKVKFTFMEDASGLISRPEVLEHIIKKTSIEHHKLFQEYGLYSGENKYINKKIYNASTQREGYVTENHHHFDLIKEMKGLDSFIIDKIIAFFGVEQKISMPERAMVILTQHFCNLGTMSFNEQIDIYKLIIDYFAQDYNLVFKPHPDDLTYYDMIFPNSTSIKTKFPSELFPFVFTDKPEVMFTISSCALDNLTEHFDTCVKFSIMYEDHYTNTHKYYSVLKIINSLNSTQKIYEYNTIELLLNNLSRFTDLKCSRPVVRVENLIDFCKGNIILIDDFQDDVKWSYKEIESFLNNLDRDSIVFFLNTNKNFIFYNYPNKKVFRYIIPVEIVHQNLSGDEELSETVYIFSKKGGLRDMISQIEFDKKLEHLNKKITVKKLSEEQLKIKMLEGVLEATEKRLEHYIKLEKELKSKLNN